MSRHRAKSRPRTAAQRLIALLPVIEFHRQHRTGRITMLLADGRKPGNLGEIVAEVARRHHVSSPAVWGWWSSFKRAGGCAAYAALARQPRSDRGAARYFRERPHVRELLVRLVIRKRLSVKAAVESIQSHIANPPVYATALSELRRVKAERRAARRRRKERL